MATIQLPIEFKEFLKSLSEFHVEYLLIGGYAVAFHGYPRATGDLDIWIAMDEENAQRMIASLDAFGFGSTGLSTDLFVRPDQITRMGFPPLRIEILTTVSGLDFAEAYSDRIETVIDGIPVVLISQEHLKTNKRASGRTKDLADLENLP
jgi:predicted nucleotidyltransferase